MKLAICGTHCSGKSTTVDRVSKELNIPKIKEVAGRFTEEERQDITTQILILLNQITEESLSEDFVSDRSVIDNCAYIRYHTLKQNIEPLYHEVQKFVNYYLSTKPYDVIFFVDEYFPLCDNGIRNLDEIQQISVFKFLKENAYLISTNAGIPCVNIVGPTNIRLDIIENWIKTQW